MRRPILWNRWLGPLAVAGVLSCDRIPRNPSDPDAGGSNDDIFLLLEPAAPSVPVGVPQGIVVTARVTRDATGGTCSFSANAGSFSATEVLGTSSSTVDANGNAVVTWYPPSRAGSALLRAQVGDVAGNATIAVTAVPTIDLTVPAELPVDTTVQASVSVPADWAGLPVEVRASAGSLTALGPVGDGSDQGNRITPQLDATGRADFLLVSPATPGQVVLTASLFGTIRSTTITVQ